MLNGILLTSINAKCKNCGGHLSYSPEQDCLLCDNCESVDKIQYSNIEEKKPYHNIVDSDIEEWRLKQKYIKCKSCGSSILLQNNEISINCSYCDSQNVVLKEEVAGLYPTKILRFTFDKKGAGDHFCTAVKKKFFVPRPFKKNMPDSKIHGFYFPAFSFDADTDSSYSGKLYRNESYTINGKTYTRKVYFNISGRSTLRLDNVLVESSAKINQAQMQEILPYNFENQADFKEEYLFGYTVEQYNENFMQATSKARAISDEMVRDKILSKYSYDGVSSLNVNTTYTNEKFAYFMVPVYTFEYEYKKKKYLNYMNGQNGVLGGGLPVSKIKVTFCTLGVLLFIAMIIAIVLLCE